MNREPSADFRAILQTLSAHEVEFIIVGGVSAVLNGAPISTFDLDIVHSREPDNLSRLTKALTALDAYYRFHPDQEIRPDKPRLDSPDHQLLMTQHGPLDVLGSIGSDQDYGDLVDHSIRLEIGDGRAVRVLDLDMLIAIKEQLNTAKDRAVLPILRRTRDEIRRS